MQKKFLHEDDKIASTGKIYIIKMRKLELKWKIRENYNPTTLPHEQNSH